MVVSDYFIESTYKVEGNTKTYKCYECTKMGCELIPVIMLRVKEKADIYIIYSRSK